MPGNGIVEFFQQQGNALTAPAPVADGIIHADFPGGRTVPEEHLHRIAYGALFRVVVVGSKLPVFRHLHFLPERIDARVGGNGVLVIPGGEAAEDQGDGGHVLDAVVTIRGVIQRAGLVDDTHACLLGFHHHLVDVSQPVPNLFMQGQGRFHRGLGVKLSRERYLEQDVFHNVTAKSAFCFDLVALEQHVLEAPVLGAERGRITHLTGQRDQGMTHRATGGLSGRPAFS